MNLMIPSSFDLEKHFLSKEGFELFDAQAEIALGDVEEATTRLAFHIHVILEYDLWRYGGFESQQEYLENLASRKRNSFAVSTMKNFHSALRLAKQLGYGSREMVEERGVWVFEAINREVITDASTGEPLRLKRGELPRGREIHEFLREAVETYGGDASGEWRNNDLRTVVAQFLTPGRWRVEFSPATDHRWWDVYWHVEAFDTDGMMVQVPGNHTRLSEGRAPEVVRDEYFKRLNKVR